MGTSANIFKTLLGSSRRSSSILCEYHCYSWGTRKKGLLRAFSQSNALSYEENHQSGALAGVKILDLSRVLASRITHLTDPQGSYCTQILADYGADVIKIEDPDRGDDTRYWRISGEDSAWKAGIGPMSNYFAAINRKKRSLTFNLKSEKGKEILMRLVEDADVVVENFRPGAMDKLGLGYEKLSKVNPMIIYASTSGYGPSDPFAKRAGYDMIAGAEAGLLHLTGERGGRPVRPGIAITDISTGLYMHGAIVTALFARQRTGKGQRIDGSLFETQVSLLTNVALSWLNLGREAERWDLYFVCGATNDKQFEKLCQQLGKPYMAKDEKFKTNEERVNNRDELFTILNELFAEKTTNEWIQAFEGSGMPYAPINTMEKVFTHPQTKARDMVTEIPFDAAKSGKISILGPAIKFSDTKATIRARPPLLGEHTTQVLEELGIIGSEADDLKEKKVV